MYSNAARLRSMCICESRLCSPEMAEAECDGRARSTASVGMAVFASTEQEIVQYICYNEN
jgi:hypothetical protein